MVGTVESELGPPTILVNNAGIAELLPAEKVTEEIFERFLRVLGYRPWRIDRP